jgi:cytochrome c551
MNKNSIKILLLIIALTSCQSKEQIRLDQYFVNGKNIYEAQCANCHQKDGKGLANLYPPIAGADFLKNKERVIYIIKNGVSGEMMVNGKTYNQQMPANPQLYDLDIAALTTYIYNQWGNEKSITEPDSVKKILEKQAL